MICNILTKLEATMWTLSGVLLLCAVSLANSNEIPDHFYAFPYDNPMFTNDDSYQHVDITTPDFEGFPFFGTRKYSLYVNTNGGLSFEAGVSSYTPQSFPIIGGRPFIAPYWGDVDTRNNWGRIYFYESQDSDILADISADVNDVYGYLFGTFQGSWCFIATYHNVTHYGASYDSSIENGFLENTFQVALVTDYDASYAIFNYADLQWTVGSASSVPAQVGFDAGDGIHFHIVEESQTDAILNMAGEQRVYKVNSETVFDPLHDWCSGSPCQNNGTCESGSLSFYCECPSGWSGDYCEHDDTIIVQTDPPATTPSFQINNNISRPLREGNLLPYGPEQHDTVVFAANNCSGCTYRDSWKRTFHAAEVKLNQSLPLITKNRCSKKKCYMSVSSTGYVTFREKDRNSDDRDMYIKRDPDEWSLAFDTERRSDLLDKGFYVIAPFWADTLHVLDDDSKLYYHVYKKKLNRLNRNDALTLDIMEKCDEMVTYYTGEEFTGNLAIIVTWENMKPAQNWWCWFESTCNSSSTNWCQNHTFDNCDAVREQTNTFQLVIVSNIKQGKTYSFYLYGEMNWVNPTKVHVGHFLQRRRLTMFDEHTESLYSNLFHPYSKTLPYEIDTRPNYQLNGESGILFYTLAAGTSEPDYDELCTDWYDEEMEQTPIPYFGEYLGMSTPEYLDFTFSSGSELTKSACPCDESAILNDWRWEFSETLSPRNNRKCYIQVWSRGTTVVACCYKASSGALFTPTSFGNKGHTYLFHPKWDWTKALSKQHDLNPKKWCCQKSENCDLYYQLRPVSSCDAYEAPSFSWFLGDPHIRTIDGHHYRFNGLGEYVLIQSPTFTMQGRTEKITDTNGVEQPATVFSAIVASDAGGDTMQVQLNANKDGILVYMIDTDITDSWFNSVETDVSNTEYELVALTKTSDLSITATFQSGFSVTITCSQRQLSIATSAPVEHMDSTMGLLGVFNNDISDDYTRRDGTTLDITATESEIYSDFGEGWRTTEQESIFIYHHGESHNSSIPTDYTPVFLDDLQQQFTEAEWQDIADTCNDDTDCMFDLAVTGNEAFAQNTLDTGNSNQEISDNMANSRPIVVPSTPIISVTLNEEVQLTLNVVDQDENDVSTLYMNMTSLESGDDLNDSAQLVGSTFTWTPTTSERVELSFYAVDSNGGVSREITMTIRLCECSSGQGVCDFTRIRPTEDAASSFQLVECDCVTGWSGAYCDVDIDGCLDNSCGCVEGEECTGSGSVCYDVAAADDIAPGGSYRCGPCNSGYEKRDGDDSECINTDECFLGTDNCDSTNGYCSDTDGSFQCGCNIGYRLHENGVDCIDVDECNERTSSCQQICTNTEGSYTCSCHTGNSLDSDNHGCTLDSSLTESCADAGCDYCSGEVGNIQCVCLIGYVIREDGLRCRDFNECFLDGVSACGENSTCENTAGSYDCNCQDGYQRNSDLRTCSACDDGYWGPDCSNVCRCLVGTECNPTTGCSQCSNSGFTGGNCDEDIDECLDDPCGEGTDICLNFYGSYYCPCLNNYERVNNTHCAEIDDCESYPCQNGGECVNTEGSSGYSCTCVDGYTGQNCETDIDECSSSPCHNNGTCHDLLGKFRCVCLENYYGTTCNTKRFDINNDENNDGSESDSSSQSSDGGLSSAQKYSIILTTVIIGVVATVVVIITLVVLKLKQGSRVAGIAETPEAKDTAPVAPPAYDVPMQPNGAPVPGFQHRIYVDPVFGMSSYVDPTTGKKQIPLYDMALPGMTKVPMPELDM